MNQLPVPVLQKILDHRNVMKTTEDKQELWFLQYENNSNRIVLLLNKEHRFVKLLNHLLKIKFIFFSFQHQLRRLFDN